MKKLVIATVAAVALLATTPALAQVGFYAGPGGFGVQVAPSYGYYDAPYGYYQAEPRYYRTEPRYYRNGRYWDDRDWRYRRDPAYGYGGYNRGYYGGPYWERW